MARITSQADQRRFTRYTDQHGRKWTACVEKESGHPCTPIQPSFLAPIIPPQKHINLGDGEDVDAPGRVFINYTTWLAEMDGAARDWLRRCHETGTELYKDSFDPSKPFNMAILNRVGARPHVPNAVTPLLAMPLPGAESLPIHACQQGNAWALGLKGPKGETPKVPAQLKDFFAKAIPEVPVFASEFETEYEEPTPKRRKPVAVTVGDAPEE